MNPQSQREALAEFIGWTRDDNCYDEYDYRCTGWRSPGQTNGTTLDKSYLPQFTTNLEAIRKVEIRLNPFQIKRYIGFLIEGINSRIKTEISDNDSLLIWRLINAPANEKAEALLKALDLWQ